MWNSAHFCRRLRWYIDAEFLCWEGFGFWEFTLVPCLLDLVYYEIISGKIKEVTLTWRHKLLPETVICDIWSKFLLVTVFVEEWNLRVLELV